MYIYVCTDISMYLQYTKHIISNINMYIRMYIYIYKIPAL